MVPLDVMRSKVMMAMSSNGTDCQCRKLSENTSEAFGHGSAVVIRTVM